MASKAQKVTYVLALFFSCSLWISVHAIPQEDVLTTPKQQGKFCYTVHSPDAPPPGKPGSLALDEQILWGSNPGLSLFLLVNVTVGQPYEAVASTVKVGAEHLSVGPHDVVYSLVVGEEEQYYLSVLVDDVLTPPENSTSAFHPQDSSFISVTVTSKGPIIHRWNQACAEPTIPPQELATHLSDSGTVPAHASHDEMTEASRSKAVYVVLWVFIGIASAGLLLLLIVGITLLIQRTSNSRHNHLVRMAEAERQKQTITNKAQRLSYIEQIKWSAEDQGGENAVRLMSS